MELAELKELYNELNIVINRFCNLLDPQDLVYASVAKLPVAERVLGVDHSFDDIALIKLKRLEGASALAGYRAAIRPQFHQPGLSGRGARRTVGTIQIWPSEPQLLLAGAVEINQLKTQLQNGVVDGRTPKARRTLWKKLVPGGIPLTVTRQLAVYGQEPVKNISYHWTDKGFSQEDVSITQVEERIDDYIQQCDPLDVDVIAIQQRLKKRLSQVNTNSLVIRRPTKVHPIMSINGQNIKAHTPALIIQCEELSKYRHLKDYDIEKQDSHVSPLKTTDLVPVLPGLGIFERKNQRR